MTTSTWQKEQLPLSRSAGRVVKTSADGGLRVDTLWICFDSLILVGAVILAVLIDSRLTNGVEDTLLHGLTQNQQRAWAFVATLCGFCATIVITATRWGLYSSTHLRSIRDEQSRILAVCLLSGLALMGTLYLFYMQHTFHNLVLLVLAAVTPTLSIR